MKTNQILNCIGLTFDIIGVLILFKFGLPSDVNQNGHIALIIEQEDEAEKRKWKKFNFLSRVGLAFILIGFAFQFLSNFTW